MQKPELPDLAWNSQTSFSQTSATTRQAWGRGRPHLRAMDVHALVLVFFWDFEGPDRSFGPGISAQMTPGCPRDIHPKNFLFGLFFRS